MITKKFEHYLLTCFNVNRVLDPNNINEYIKLKLNPQQIVHSTNVQNKIETNAVPIFNLEVLKRFHLNQLSFAVDPSLIKYKNRFNIALSLFKNKKKRSLTFRLKLALYTLIPQISILFNQFKLRIPLTQKINQAPVSVATLKELISNF